MYSIIVKLVLFWLIVGWGLIGLGLAFVGLAVTMAFFDRDATDRPFWAASIDAACEISSSLSNPLTIGLESRVLRSIIIDPDSGIDFRALPDRWRHVCLTYVESGGPNLPASYRLPFLNFERSLCWGWSPRAITVLLIEENGATFPFQLKVPATIAGRVVNTSPRACSLVKQAVARCGGDDRSCAFEWR